MQARVEVLLRMISVNYLHILVEKDGDLIYDDTNLDIKTQHEGDKGKGAF